jgi:HSP20 family protein
MGIKDVIRWNNGGREVAIHRGADVNPFFTLHREMNGIFDDVFRGFDLAPFGSPGRLSGLGWPQIDIDETDKEVRISERYYGRFERRIPLKDIDEDKVSAAFKNGVLTITVPKSD